MEIATDAHTQIADKDERQHIECIMRLFSTHAWKYAHKVLQYERNIFTG